MKILKDSIDWIYSFAGYIYFECKPWNSSCAIASLDTLSESTTSLSSILLSDADLSGVTVVSCSCGPAVSVEGEGCWGAALVGLRTCGGGDAGAVDAVAPGLPNAFPLRSLAA